MTQEPQFDGYLPLALRIRDLPCLIVGGGRVGTRKALRLAAAGAAVTVVAPEITAELREACDCGRLAWLQGAFEILQLDGARLVVAATNDAGLNRAIGEAAELRGILVCVASSAEACRVIFPAVWSNGQVTVAVHSQGKNCQQSKDVRDAIGAWLGETSAAASSATDDAQCESTPENGPAIQRLCNHESRDAVGKVYIIGAGPGASDLITLRGYHALQLADAVLADRLVPRGFLFELGISEEGKIVQHLGDQAVRWSQEQINEWLVEMAQAGHTVARLKGGDPFVFGRGDSEIEMLARHGIAWEAIPGATSATAVLASAGFPLTRHAEGRSFAVTTARVEGGRVINALPKADTLVILMGITALPEIVARLREDGWPADAPAAIVERGTLVGERRASGTLDELCMIAARDAFAAPAIVVVGEAARSIPAIKQRPTILFTGLDPTAFRSLGNLLHWPAQQIAPHPQAHAAIDATFDSLARRNVDWLVFTDKQAVVSFVAAMAARRLDARCLGATRIASLSPATTSQLVRGQLQPDLAFADMDNASVVRQLKSVGDRASILLVQGSHSSNELADQLRAVGNAVTQVQLHLLAPHPGLARPLPPHDIVYFVSPAGVRIFVEHYGGLAALQREAWCLGKATQRALSEHGVAAKIVPPR